MSELIADINTKTDEEVTLDHIRNIPYEKATAETQNRQNTFVE